MKYDTNSGVYLWKDRKPLSVQVMFFEDDLSKMTHHSPPPPPPLLFGGKVAMEKMAITNTFGPVLMNSRCTGYMLADHN